MKNKIKEYFCGLFSEKFNFGEVLVLMLLTIVVGIALGRVTWDKTNNHYFDLNQSSSLEEFISNYQYIVNNYYGELNEEELLSQALQSIIEEIDDPYATYMDETDASNFEIQLSGRYQGVGIEIGNVVSTGELVITKVFEDSPAQKIGLQIADIVIKINGELLGNINSSELAKRIKTAGDKFELTVLRNGEEKSFQVQLEEVVLKSVNSNMFADGIGYISISLFADNTYEQMKKNLEKLETQGMKSLIIDVRNNTGGYLTSVDKILGLFLDSSHVIYQIKDKTGVKKYYSKGKVTKDYQIVVLTNSNSASASEILTAALKEEQGAISIGKKTYGKGTAQKLHTLSDGTKYKFTSQIWLTPTGKSIDGNGVEVDIDVQLDNAYYEDSTVENDNQLQEAIKFLKNEIN